MGIVYETKGIWHEGTKQFLKLSFIIMGIISLCGVLYEGEVILARERQSKQPQEKPTATFVMETPISIKPENQNCVVIDGLNPPGRQDDGLAPTAWSAWEELGEPSTVNFLNEAGPDANPDNPQELNAPENLPRLVHNGDRFCLPNE